MINDACNEKVYSEFAFALFFWLDAGSSTEMTPGNIRQKSDRGFGGSGWEMSCRKI